MFGVELQVSKNLFLEGVRDREVAYSHDSGLIKLEGDETRDPRATSELEFVTAPCKTLEECQKAVGYARDLAVAIADLAKFYGGIARFQKGQKFMSGVWEKDCTVFIDDAQFTATPQATVGVPLAGLKTFIEGVLASEGEEGAGFLADLVQLRKDSGLDIDKESKEVAGFLTACHIFLIWATRNFMPEQVLGPDGRPLEPKGKRPDSWLVVAIKSEYLEGIKYRPPSSSKYAPPDGKPLALETDADGICRLLVNRDSPKSSFKLLHRTDFYSMFHALKPDQQARLQTEADLVPSVVWPRSWRPNYSQLFVYPYRADPPDETAKKTGLVKEYPAVGWPGDEVTRPPEKWWITEHGPTLAQWWGSVVNGQPMPDEDPVKKDLASPPPGFRGRSPDKLARFPKDDEDKREYYGMGAFPMDTSDQKQPPLAVYEYRAFDAHPALAKLSPLTMDNWAAAVEVFYKNFVPKS